MAKCRLRHGHGLGRSAGQFEKHLARYARRKFSVRIGQQSRKQVGEVVRRRAACAFHDIGTEHLVGFVVECKAHALQCIGPHGNILRDIDFDAQFRDVNQRDNRLCRAHVLELFDEDLADIAVERSAKLRVTQFVERRIVSGLRSDPCGTRLFVVGGRNVIFLIKRLDTLVVGLRTAVDRFGIFNSQTKIARIDFGDDIVSLIVISGIDLEAVDRPRYTE